VSEDSVGEKDFQQSDIEVDDMVDVTVKRTCEQIHDDLDAFNCQRQNNVYALFPAEQMKFSLISEAEESCGFLYQLEMQHNWYDPVAIYMESWFSKKFSLAEFRNEDGCDCKYVLQIKFLLQMLNSFLTSICMQEAFIVSWMLSWFHWKHDYT